MNELEGFTAGDAGNGPEAYKTSDGWSFFFFFFLTSFFRLCFVDLFAFVVVA